MPRKAKDEINLVKEKTVPTSKKVGSKKDTTATSKKVVSKSNTKVEATKKTTSRNTAKRITEPKNKTKSTEKKDSTSPTTVKQKSERKARASSKNIKPEVEILEYYDLPYRYNETVVKVLAQTPDILFVYWDISDRDKENYIKQYGEYFFNDTKPVLIVYNDTLNYSFEVDINDFANSWYLHISDSNCDYHVELGRRPINEYAKINHYLYISSSNNMALPNDHILFDSLNNNVYFKNVKTNITTKKELSLSFFSKIGKIYDVKDFYKKLYKDENIDFEKLNLKNMPSS